MIEGVRERREPRREWGEALDDLEQNLEVAERLAAGVDAAGVDVLELVDLVAPLATAPWQPPRLEHPMPAELAGRAHDLLARHARVGAQLERRRELVGRELAGLARTSAPARRTGEPQAAAYLDVSV